MSTAPKPRQTWQEFLDSAGGMSRRQRVVVLLTFLAMVTEGLDISIASFVYPEIVRDWGTSLGAITATVTSGVLAMAIGSVLAGPFADRYGRRSTVVVGMVLFGTTTAAMGLTTSIEPLMILRVAACVGLGGTVPVLLAVVADAVPSGRRAQMVSLAFCGVAVGTIVGGFLASAIIPVWGWPALLVSCGLAPLFLVPPIVLLVPDSPGVLIARGRPIAEVRSALATLVPGRDLSTVSFAAPAGTGSLRRVSGVATVLSRRFALTTVLLWLAFFIGLGVAFLILNYLPLMVRQQNFSAAQTGVIIGTFGWGAFIGQALVSFALKRFDRFLVVASLWALGLAGIFVVAAFTFGFAGLLLVVFGLGLSLASVSAALNAIGALAYPPAARATGMGWANGAGRLGTLASGLLGGLMLTAGWTIDMIFLAMGAPVAVGIAAAFLLRADDRRRLRRDTAPPAVRRPARTAE
ncbi:aromatic acid/H+ symport family MFS transporter [Prauserella endophytica]|uniref:Aromatic acid/H+ symport family MFS transporter n=1 Tax=Prauserella endophytica TaxID=1592324 RepID=A0ABY2S2L9_9PSEU|nr:aromatic acid/H+ symport family MFS transporter [Prauserella endophytica]